MCYYKIHMRAFSRYSRSFLIGSSIFIAFSFSVAENKTISPENQRVVLLGLIQSLHRDAASAQQAAQALGNMGADAAPAVEDLVQTFQSDEESVFMAARDALIKIGPASLAPLTLVLGHPSFIVRRRAALTLALFGPQAQHAAPDLVGLLADPYGDVHDAAEKALMQIGDPAIPALAAGLKSSASGNREVVMTTLGRMGPKAVPILIVRLQKDDNAFIRVSAAEALGLVQPASSDVQEALIRALSDLEENVRGAAADSLGQLKPPATGAIGPLLVVSQDDHDAYTRKRAAQALERIGPATPESLPGLSTAQRDANAEVRRQVIDIIGKSKMNWPIPLPLLAAGVKDSDDAVRLKTVQVAAKLAKPGPDVLPIFRQAIGDPVVDVRLAAVSALGQWKEDSADASSQLNRALSDSNSVVRQQAIQGLANLGAVGLPGLIQALSDSLSLLGDQAADAIVALGQEAVPALEEIQKGPDPVMQKKAAQILKRIARKTRTKSAGHKLQKTEKL